MRANRIDVFSKQRFYEPGAVIQYTLERRQAEQNVFRFYRLEQGPDLFGTPCVTRNWGRIGTQGRQKIESFDTPAEALRALGRLAKAKRNRGYIDVTAAP